MRERLLRSLLITAVFASLWLMPPASQWFHAFVKLEPMRLPYTVGFFALMFCALSVLNVWIAAHSPVAVGAMGACAGQIAAMISIFTANLFIPDGTARTLTALERQGIVGILVTDFTVSAVLGGWLIGAIAFLAMKWLMAHRKIGST